MSRKTIIITLLFAVFFMSSHAWATDEDEIRALIENKTVDMFHKKKDVEMQRFFAKDGTMLQMHSENGFSKGNWSIEDDKLCFVIGGKAAKCRPVMEKDDEYGLGNRKGSKMQVMFNDYKNGNTLDIPKEELAEVLSEKHATEEVVTINTREGVTQTFLHIVPTEKPKGVVIIYPGHEGVVRFKKIANQYSVDNEGGGLTAHEKSREKYSQEGFAVAVLAPPSDQSYGMDTDFRSSKEHTQDTEKVIEYLHQKYNQDVYLHGHCRSTFSPAAVATNLNNKGIAGIILSSARSEGRHGGVVDYEKGKVKVPVLLVQHVDDPCEGTLYENMPKIKSFYEASTNVDVITAKGGEGKRPDDAPGCSGGHHGFRGMRKPVMNAIIQWINKEEFPKHIVKD